MVFSPAFPRVIGPVFDRGFGTAFQDPSDLSGLTLWFDASDASTVFDATTGGSTPSDGGTVKRWEDKSANGYDITEATNPPTYKTSIQNSLNVIRYDGSNDILFRATTELSTISGDPDVTIFAVQMQESATANNTTFSLVQDNTNRLLLHATYSNTIYFDCFNTTGGRASGAQPAGWDDSWHVVLAQRSSTTSIVDVDGTNVITDTSVSGSRPSITSNLAIGAYKDNVGNNYFFDGDIGEVIVYNRALSASELSQVESYLASKWGITLS